MIFATPAVKSVSAGAVKLAVAEDSVRETSVGTVTDAVLLTEQGFVVQLCACAVLALRAEIAVAIATAARLRLMDEKVMVFREGVGFCSSSTLDLQENNKHNVTLRAIASLRILIARLTCCHAIL